MRCCFIYKCLPETNDVCALFAAVYKDVSETFSNKSFFVIYYNEDLAIAHNANNGNSFTCFTPCYLISTYCHSLMTLFGIGVLGK